MATLTIALTASSLRSRLHSYAQNVEARTKVYVSILLALAGLCVGAETMYSRISIPWATLGLAIAAAFAERGRVKIGERHEESISLLPTLLAAVLGGPIAGSVVGAASFAIELKAPYSRWCAYTAMRTICGGAAGAIAVTIQENIGAPLVAMLIATAVAALALQVLDGIFVACTSLVRRAFSSVNDLMRARGLIAVAALPLSVPIVVMLAVAYREVSPWTLPLFAVPALGAHRLYVIYQGKALLAEELCAANEKLEAATFSFATALVAALDARDRYTAGHSEAVATYAEAIAVEVGLTADEIALVRSCALVHDIGKIALPTDVLQKRGPLNADERTMMQSHPEIGADILSRGSVFAEMAPIVRHHHERIDGRGYPCALVGSDIPVLSRIIAVADAYDAMVSDRPYRAALDPDEAIARLIDGSGSQFDAAVVHAFCRCLGRDEGTPRLARRVRSESGARSLASVA